MIGQLLEPAAPARRKARAAELLEWFDLTDAAGRMAKTYSGGMRRRLDLAASLVGRPAVIFLDEPTTGLDPAKREDMWDVVRNLVTDGSTVLLTTQYLEEADALADEISVIDHGRVIAHDTPDGLKRVVGGQRIAVRPTDPARLDDVARILAEIGSGAPESSGRNQLTVPVPGEESLPRARAAARPRRASACTELSLHLPSLDEVFLTLTGRRAGDDEPQRYRDRRPHAGVRHEHHARSSRRADARLDRHGLTPDGPAAGSLVGYLRHVLVLAKRSLIKTWRTPEALIDVTLQPIIFLVMFTYIFGGAIARRLPAAVPAVPAARHPRPDHRDGRHRARHEPQHRHREGRLRPVPVAADRPRRARWSAPSLADVARYIILCVVTLGAGYLMGFRVQTNAVEALAAMALCIAFALCFCWISVFVGMVARTSGAVQGIMFLIVLPLSFGSNTFVPTATMPGWLQAFVKVNPISHLVATVRGSDARWAVRERPGLDAGLDGGPAGGLRSARPVGLPQARLIRG